MLLRPDDLLEKGPGRWTRERVAEAWAECFRQLRAALALPSILRAGVLVGIPGAGKTTWSDTNDREDTCLFDAVWADPRRRARVARRIRAAGKHAIAIWVRTPLELCIERNAKRPEWRQVPVDTMRKNAAMLQRFPPTLREGWSTIEVVDGTRAIATPPVRLAFESP